MADAGRVYGGRSEEERRADRRARLVAAGLELFGTEGWAGATIERLCAGAGVATRSFYEEFSSREALLRAVYED
ncbi:MAG: TetR/AcrR family transcriptional regulator, partial [Mycobacteriales bacterium]